MSAHFRGRLPGRDRGKERKSIQVRRQPADVVHGLLGMIRYQRAYYISEKKGEGSWIPLDEQLGIAKEHTPGLQYILSGFTAREVSQGSLDWFHQIFRPDGKDLVSMRKALGKEKGRDRRAAPDHGNGSGVGGFLGHQG